MKSRSTHWLLLAGLAMTLLSGCQGYNFETGMTLPSGHYLRHPPQYFAPSEPYPLPKELRSLEEAAKQEYDNPRR